MTVAIVVCVEGNRTGSHAVAAVRSLRAFGGSASSTPVVAVSPRRDPPGPAVIRDLRACGIEYIEADLNLEFRTSGYANKPLVMAWAERTLDVRRLVFCDSDSLFLNDPSPLLEAAAVSVAPVWATGVGSRGDDDPADAVWRAAVRGRLPRPCVRTVVTGELIRPYFNSGLVAADRSSELFTSWSATYRRLAADPAVIATLARSEPAREAYFEPATFLDQLALAVALIEGAFDVEVLDDRYNRPLHYSEQIGAAGGSTLAGVVHAQHQGYLGDPAFQQQIQTAGELDAARIAWWTAHAAVVPDEELEWPPTFISRFDAEFEAWRCELRSSRSCP